MRAVIDPEIALSIAAGLPVAAAHGLLAPTLLRSEALATLFARVRAGTMTEAAALDLNARVSRLKVRYLGDAVLRRRAWGVAMAAGLTTTCPAEYVALTILQGDVLVTADPTLVRIADGRVEVLRPNALSR